MQQKHKVKKFMRSFFFLNKKYFNKKKGVITQLYIPDKPLKIRTYGLHLLKKFFSSKLVNKIIIVNIPKYTCVFIEFNQTSATNGGDNNKTKQAKYLSKILINK